MRIFLQPHEALLFRTGRPFDAGESNYAETLFPPTPETIQGAVRALIASAQDEHAALAQLFQRSELVALIGDRQGYGRFRITNIALARYPQHDSTAIEPLYPAPAHLAKDEQGYFRLLPVEQTEIGSYMPPGMRYLLPPKGRAKISSNMPSGMRYLLPPEGRAKGKIRPVEGWLSENGLQCVLSAEEDLSTIKGKEKIEVIRGTDVYLHEPRVGIGMNAATKSTQDGMFYGVQMLRLRQDQGFVYGFLVDVPLADGLKSGSLLPDEQTRETLNLDKRSQGWVVLGGEQRAASYKILDEARPLPHRPARSGQRSLLYLATPAVFTNGWRPDVWPEGLAPIAAAVPRYQSIGGWALDPGRSGGGANKTMRRCVPAGSVYFFDSSLPLSATLNNEYGKEIGYGITIAGEW